MSQQNQTRVSRLRARSPIVFSNNTEGGKPSVPEWHEDERPTTDHFFRNLTVAATMVLCVVTLRTGAIPPLDHTTDAVLTAATDQSLLDEQLGKLSFVNALFPEAVLVFGEQQPSSARIPIDAEAVTHAWSEEEPYTCWRSNDSQIVAASEGEVTGIFHGYEDELIVEVSDASNLTWLYGNLSELAVSLGDQLKPGDPIGHILSGEDLALEVRCNGRSFDPQSIFEK